MQTLRTVVLPAAIGGVVVAAAFLLFGDVGNEGGRTTTVLQQAPVGTQSARLDTTSSGPGPTAHDVYRRAAKGVVFVRSQVVQDVESPFDVFPSAQRSEATASGFLIDRKGRILTNYHVVAGASAVTVSFEDKRTVPARIVGTDPSKDLALLKMDPKAHRVSPLPLGRSSSVEVGDPVLAIGNPFGFDRTLTSGIVSALQRQIVAPNGFTIDDVIQTDAAINPGNSGGPLLDGMGRVVGINSQIATGESGSGSVGIGFAVPVDTARKDLHGLETKGRIERPWIGIVGSTVDPALGLDAKTGVLIQEVTPGSPADKAGLHAAQDDVDGGDVVTEVDGTAVAGIEELTARLAARRPGQKVRLTVRRGGDRHTVRVTLGAQPARASTQAGAGG